MDEDRNIMVIDTFGTADEDRFWDAKKYDEGEIVEYSKEFVRQYYKNDLIFKCPCKDDCSFSYYDLLYKSREEGLSEPAIPPLPEGMVKKTADLYKDLYAKITGQEF
jgi:phosphoribosylaminoimidazole-succinocarboxamide synthase